MDVQLYKKAMQLLEEKRAALAAEGKLQKLQRETGNTTTARKGEL
jgi:hypothetical protein